MVEVVKDKLMEGLVSMLVLMSLIFRLDLVAIVMVAELLIGCWVKDGGDGARVMGVEDAMYRKRGKAYNH